VLSFALHCLVIWLLVRVGIQEAAERGNPLFNLDQRPGGGGGGGTGGAGFVALTPPPPPPPPEVIEVPIVTPTVIPEPTPQPEVPPPVTPPPPAPAPTGAATGTQGTDGGTGGGQGTGTGPGSGSGVGPGSGGGTGGGTSGGGRRGRAPEPRTLIIPPIDDVPRALRGDSVVVTFYIDPSGQVTDLFVTPPIADRRFAREFDSAMRNYRFKPARDEDGRAVAGVLPVTLTFPRS
jgi:protein TonB